MEEVPPFEVRTASAEPEYQNRDHAAFVPAQAAPRSWTGGGMSYRLKPVLVNGRFGDPVLYVGFEFEKRGLLLDAGDISALEPAKLRRVSDLFVSHAHLDHFADFDRLLRHQLDQEQELRVYGPAGIIEKTGHKLAAYSWNLEPPSASDALRITVTEILSLSSARRAAFALGDKFRQNDIQSVKLTKGRLLDDHDVVVDCTVLDHKLPCLAFALREQAVPHIVEEKLIAEGLPVGPWLYSFKQALRRNEPAGTLITIDESRPARPLGELVQTVTAKTAQRKICYVTDCQFNARNAARVVALAEGADVLFIEAKFAQADSAIAKARYHLTTAQAGGLAARAGADRVEVFHFSERYEGDEARLLAEVQKAFQEKT